MITPDPTGPTDNDSSSSAEERRTRVDWSREEMSALLNTWGSHYESLKSALNVQRKTVEPNVKEISKKVQQIGRDHKQNPRADQEANKKPGI